jgi:flagellar protein FlaG
MANDISTILPGGVRVPGRVEPLSAARVEQTRTADKQAPPDPVAPAGKARPGALDEVVSGLNKMVQNLHRNLQFSVDDESGETIIKVVDSDTNEVVRQIPSEEVVKLRQRMKEAAGVLFQGAV